ncbi:MAG: complex I NDUFA9 subunit family protein [Gammaproteobacteria bacterium]
MNIKTVTLLGGTGFVGGHLATALSNAGYKVRILARRPERHRDLRVLKNCQVVQLDACDVAGLSQEFAQANAVINLVGLLHESKGASFEDLHVKLAEKVIEACLQSKTPRLLHMSALNASESQNKSNYLHSKGKGENRVHTLSAGSVKVTSFRPSVIFGPGDSFINRFAQLLRIPGPMPLACPDARFAPVYIGDVTQAFVKALEDKRTWGKRYELCGPRTFTLRQLVEYIMVQKGIHKPLIGLGDSLSRLQARILGNLPGKPFTMDNYRSLQLPSVCNEDGLAQLGIEATDMDAIVPRMLRGKR